MGAVASPASDPDLLLDGCTVRLLAGGPVLLSDATHYCSTRVTGVSIDATTGDLRIEHDPVSQVVSATAAIDETLALRGVICGPSAGLDLTLVTFYSTVTHTRVRADSAAVVGNTSNIFMTWLSVP